MRPTSRERRLDLRLEVLRIGLAVGVIVGADLGGDGEAGRHRQAEIGHLGKARALAAEQVAHLGRALGLAAAEARRPICVPVPTSWTWAPALRAVRSRPDAGRPDFFFDSSTRDVDLTMEPSTVCARRR